VPIDIFLSVGSALTLEQAQFVDAVCSFLRDHDLNPRTVGRTDFTDRQPLKRISEVLRECSGTIVIALRRIYIDSGNELRDASSTSGLTNVSLPTVWNQIEAAMAYSMDQPLLAIVEAGLRNEGVLEDGYDWYVKWLNLDPASLAEPGFLKLFSAWKNNVMKFQGENFPHLE
jgi:hypothetical protein